jgi:hypothetical protein
LVFQHNLIGSPICFLNIVRITFAMFNDVLLPHIVHM